MLARNLRYVCDFDTDFIISQLPDWGLAPSEVRSTVESAVKSVRMAVMPNVLREIIGNATKQLAMQNAEIFRNTFDCNIKEEGLIGEFVKKQPPYLKNAAYLCAMACFGTLLTRLRGTGCDGSIIAPNFMVCVSAPQATGKSFMKRIYEDILAPVKREDERQRKIMRDIDKENQRNRDKDGYEEKEFEGAIRLLPTNTSNRILLERMDKAKGQHLMIMAEEIDSITKAEKSGRWSEKSDIYRLAYDNSEWGQDYASENSYKAVVPLYLNLLFSGTPLSVGRFFNDIENGLVTRFLFINLPDTYGQKRPKRMNFNSEEREYINSVLQKLYNQMQACEGEIMMDTSQMVDDSIKYYDEVLRKRYLADQDDVCVDLARRRYSDYAVKMMMIETYLNNGIYTESIRDRVIAITNLCTEQLCATYGDQLNESLNASVEKNYEATMRSQKVKPLDTLNVTFTATEYKAVLVSTGGKASSASNYLKRLMDNGIIKQIERGVYEKI